MLFGLFTILPFTACLFWTMVLLLDWRRDNAAQHVLTVFMGVSATLYLCHAVFFNHESSWSAISESIYAFCNIGVFPLYYLYICRLTDRRGLSWRHLMVLLPTMVIGVWTALLQLFFPDDTSADELRMTVMRIVFMAQLVPISLICYRKLKNFDNEIANSYADTEARSVHTTSRMMWLLVGGALLSGIANFLGRDYFASSELMIRVPSVLFTILLFGVGYVGKRQEFCIDDLLQDESRASQSGVALSEEPSHIISRLDSLMAEKRIFLRPDLRLSEVATMLNIGRTTLSQRINQELHLSFSDYINNLRIDYACRELSNPGSDTISLTRLAEQSGFSSDSSFYRAFRRYTGKTPKQFINSL